MTVKEMKELLSWLPDDAEVVVGCEGYCSYSFENRNYFDGEYGETQLTLRENMLVIHPRNDEVNDYR